MKLFTVKEVAARLNLSVTLIYNHIKAGRLDIEMKNNKKMVTEKSLLNLIETSYKSIEPTFQEDNTNLNRVDNLNNTIEELKKTIEKLTNDKEVLFNRLIENESARTKEVISLQTQKHEELKLYMTFIDSQSKNILSAESSENSETEHIIDVEEPKKKKKKSKKKKKNK